MSSDGLNKGYGHYLYNRKGFFHHKWEETKTACQFQTAWFYRFFARENHLQTAIQSELYKLALFMTYCGTSNMVNIYIHVNKINTVFNNLTLCTLSLHCSRRWACLCFLVIQNTLIISIFQKFTILKNSTAVVLNNDQLY